METKELKEKLTSDLCSLGYQLYDVVYQKKDNILSIIIDKQMDLKEIEDLSNKLSQIMDLYDEDFEPYLLDVTTVGAERPIRNVEEMKKALGSYIFVKNKELQIYGDLVDFDGEILTINYLEKQKTKQIKINYDSLKSARYAVNFKGE